MSVRLEALTIIEQTAVVYMGRIKKADILVMLADFFLKLAEAAWCIVSGISDRKLIVIIRNAGFRRDAGKLAQRLFGAFGSAGGHRNAARAEIPIENIGRRGGAEAYKAFVLERIKKSGPAAA